LAKTTGRSGGALRDRDGPIHTRDVRDPDGKKWRGV
jgi:hypothetical protein